MKMLNKDSLSLVPAEVTRPNYDRQALGIGIVHLGPGAFHRAHQAAFTEDLLNTAGGDWGICAVSMRSRGVRDNLARQDNLYTLAVLDASSRYQVIGAVKEVLVLEDDRQLVMARLTSPQTHLVTLTITEKGYCLKDQMHLDRQHADIRHDLAHPDRPVSAVGLLVAALKRRFEQGTGPLTIVSCDNLSDNGHKLGQAVRDFAAQLDARLADWIAGQVSFPCTMVDSITPATDEALKQRVADKLQLVDNWPIQREAFSQWVIEDKFSGPRPAWEQVGVTFTEDVGSYEKAKLRILNGSHSSLAYLGLLCGYETVYEAVSDNMLKRFARALLKEEVIPSLQAPRELDLKEYADAIIRRYENPQLRHLLAQIAWDGSQKLPFRLLDTIRDNLRKGHAIQLLCLGVAAWLQFLLLRKRQGVKLMDPLAGQLMDIASQCSGNDKGDIERFLSLQQVFPSQLTSQQDFVRPLTRAYLSLSQLPANGPEQVLGDYL